MTEHDPAPPGQLQCANVTCGEDAEYAARADRLDGTIEYGLCAGHRGVRAVRPLSWCGACGVPLLGDAYDRSHIVNMANAETLGCDPGVFHADECPACAAGLVAPGHFDAEPGMRRVPFVVVPRLTPEEVQTVIDALHATITTWQTDPANTTLSVPMSLHTAFSEALANHRGPG